MELSEYEVKRQRRIKTNQQKLKALGIPAIPLRAVPIARTKKETKAMEPVRRSLRQRQLHANATENRETKTESVLLSLKPLPPHPKRAKREVCKLLDLPLMHLPALTTTTTTQKGKRCHESSSQIEIQFGDFHSKYLGTQLMPAGKQTVMQGLCPSGIVPKFSKMSGVQPWKNAVALFVNVESESPYDNVFSHEDLVDGQRAVYFQWFGQNRWHEESPMVVRLSRMKRGDERLRFDESYYDKRDKERSEPLLLFLRHVQGPYVYCGRLGYLGHRTASRPFEFRWQLLDVDSMQWEHIRDLVDSSSPSSQD